MHLQQKIEHAGLDAHEASVYLASLALGEASLSDLARTAKLPRSSCADAILRLRKKELLQFYVKRRRKIYVAADPDMLFGRLQDAETAFREALPELRALGSGNRRRPSVRFCEGREGIQAIFQDILDAKYPARAITEMEWAQRLLSGEFEEFIARRVLQRLPLKLLTARTPESVRLKTRDAAEYRETRFLPQGYDFETAQWTYGDHVAVFSLSRAYPMGLIIVDERIANTQRMLFDLAWRQAALT